MSFRALNQKYFEPISQTLMIVGIVALCQPWNEFLHRYGLTITLIGLIGFSIATKIPPDDEQEDGDSRP